MSWIIGSKLTSDENSCTITDLGCFVSMESWGRSVDLLFISFVSKTVKKAKFEVQIKLNGDEIRGL